MSKILHRIFFNFNDGPDPFLPYLETWKRELPDFEIKLWDKTNLPLDLNVYTRTLAEEKNHAFLSDYFRCWLLEKYGGIYLDADIEILDGTGLRAIYDDTQRDANYDLFIGVESISNGKLTAHSMGVKDGTFHPALRFLMNLYENALSGPLHYAIKRFDMPYLMSLYFLDRERKGEILGSKDGVFRGLSERLITNRVLILPPKFFSPLTSRDGVMTVSSFGSETCLCHHFAATWQQTSSGGVTAKKLKDALLDKDYAIYPDLVDAVLLRFPDIGYKMRTPGWTLKETEIRKIEKVLNRLIPFGSPLYRMVKGKVR